MAQGIHVFGAASIGALRAAELDAFGMRGIGRIYEDFRDGVLARRRRGRGVARPRGARLSAADRGDGQHPRDHRRGRARRMLIAANSSAADRRSPRRCSTRSAPTRRCCRRAAASGLSAHAAARISPTGSRRAVSTRSAATPKPCSPRSAPTSPLLCPALCRRADISGAIKWSRALYSRPFKAERRPFCCRVLASQRPKRNPLERLLGAYFRRYR